MAHREKSWVLRGGEGSMDIPRILSAHQLLKLPYDKAPNQLCRLLCDPRHVTWPLWAPSTPGIEQYPFWADWEDGIR